MIVQRASLFLVFIIFANGQPLWDYNDYNTLVFPPAFGQSFQSMPPKLQVQPPLAQFPMLSLQPSQAQIVPPPAHHHLGSASYRPPAGKQRFGDKSLGAYYTGRGNSYIGSSSEHSAQIRHQSNQGDLDNLLARIVTKLPSIADQFKQLMTTTPAAFPIRADFWLPFVQPESEDGNKLGENVNVGRSHSSASVINSMPEPSALFSFNKLLSAITSSNSDGSVKFAKPVDPSTYESFDVESVKGAPILKDEDSELAIVQRVVDEELPSAHSSESNGLQSDDTTTTSDFIIFTLPANLNENETITEKLETAKMTENVPTDDNLLGSLFNGKLHRANWLGSIFNNVNRKELSSQGDEDGNALAQLFSDNSLFGSAMQSDEQKPHKHEDQSLRQPFMF